MQIRFKVIEKRLFVYSAHTAIKEGGAKLETS